MGIKSYSFHGKSLNVCKVDLLRDKAYHIREYKNAISQYVCSSAEIFSELMQIGRFDWINKFRGMFKEITEECNNQDISNAIESVYDAYENKRESVVEKTEYRVYKGVKRTFYKKNCRGGVKGSVRSFEIQVKSTPLTKTLSYLTKNWHGSDVSWLRNLIYSTVINIDEMSKDPEISDKDVEKLVKTNEFRKECLALYMKYPERIASVIESRLLRLSSRLMEHPIEFTSLTYNSVIEQKQPILEKNENTSSVHNAYITLSGQKTQNGKIVIPVKYSSEHHGDIENYNYSKKKTGYYTASYTVIFPESRKTKRHVRIVLAKKTKDEPGLPETYNYLGVDVNVKHNLFALCDGKTLDYDRELLNDYLSYLKGVEAKISDKVSRGLSKSMSFRDLVIHRRWQVRIKSMLKSKASELVDYAVKNGYDHIVMEDLGQMGKSYARADEFQGVKYSALIRYLNLVSLKDIVTSIANKQGINVSFVQPHYTSKGCRKCGHISDNNRKTQELFKCENCNHTEAADIHAAKNIKSRVAIDVLRTKLLSKCGSHWIPRKLSKESIKAALHGHSESTVGLGGFFTVPYRST